MGGPSWQFKKFADASSKPWYVQAWKDKLFAGFTSSAATNGDKFSTLNYFFTLAMQHGGLWVGNGMLPSNRKASQRDDVNWIGAYSGVMGLTPADVSAAEMAPGDLETARQFGQRIAAVAARLAA
jgi:multimeric flavodoxin WrbA